MKKNLKAGLWLILTVILSTAATFQDNGYKVTQLNPKYVDPYGINNFGLISGFYKDGLGGWHGFITTGQNPTIIDLPGHVGRTWVYGINDLSQVVGNTDGFGFIDTSGIFTNLNVPGDWNGSNTAARGINNSNRVVGFYTYMVGNFPNRGFLYDTSSSSFTKLDFPEADATSPAAINNSGEVVGSYTKGWYSYGFLKSENFSTLEVPNSSDTFALGMNNRSQVVGYYLKDTKVHGFLLTGGNYITLDIQNADSTWLTGINDSGRIVGFFESSSYLYAVGFIANPPGSIVPMQLLLLRD